MTNQQNSKSNVIQGPWGEQVTSEHIATAASLKPETLKNPASATWAKAATLWDDLAPELVFLDRLKSRFVLLFQDWCYQNARIAFLRDWLDQHGDLYETETRNGEQKKSHPYVAQVHEHWRQMLRLTEKFGLTPADEKSLVRSVHGDMVDEFGQFKD